MLIYFFVLIEIPALLAPATEIKKDDVDMEDPDAEAAATAAAIDDGLGAFRPSTSFNNLSTLLPPESAVETPNAQADTPEGTPAGTPAPVQAPAPVAVPSAVPSPALVNIAAAANPPDTKKRTASSTSAESPVAKRRASTGRKGSSAAKSKAKNSGGNSPGANEKTQPAGDKQTKGAKQNDRKKDTPNPLTSGETQQQPVKVQPIKPVVKPVVAVSSQAAVVTPRVQAPAPVEHSEDDSLGPSSYEGSTPPTEADFQSVAQAAVSNLIMNAGNGKAESANPAPGTNIDTSTEHIKALTGSNWVAVCSGGDIGGPASSESSDKMNNRARRQNLTADERARQNRDRNREHARNTRLRKKAYVEELKRTLTALVAQRDAADLEKRHSAQRELEQREVRFRVVEEFLKLRGRKEENFARWAAILEENFTLTLPVTDFRETIQSKTPGAKTDYLQTLTGVSEAMADASLLASFLKSLGKSSEGDAIYFQYQCDRKNFFMDNCIAVLDWTASSQGAIQHVSLSPQHYFKLAPVFTNLFSQGASNELTLKGNLKAHFSPASNKLISVVMSFDTGVVMSQLNQLMKAPELTSDDAAATAAQVAANEADAILDSLEMPHIEASSVPSNVNIVAASCSGSSTGPASITDLEKEDSSDESHGDLDESTKGMTSRRALRSNE
jgi:hypothetical protein